MSVALPIINGSVHGPVAPVAQPGAGQAAVPGTGPMGAGNVSAVQGTGPITGLHNTPLHVSGILLGALALIVMFNVAGFRFATDVSVGLGK